MTQLVSPADTELPFSAEEEYSDNARDLLRAALVLFARRGYAATSVRDIVDSAGVTNPMLYYYFDSKEGLFHELITYLFETLETRICEALETAETFEARVDAVVRVHLEGCRESPIALQFTYVTLFGPDASMPDFDVFEVRAPIFDRVQAVFEEAIDSGQLEPEPAWTPEEMTEQLLGTINSHMMRTLGEIEHLEDEMHRLEHLERMLGADTRGRIVRFFLNGVEHS